MSTRCRGVDRTPYNLWIAGLLVLPRVPRTVSTRALAPLPPPGLSRLELFCVALSISRCLIARS